MQLKIYYLRPSQMRTLLPCRSYPPCTQAELLIGHTAVWGYSAFPPNSLWSFLLLPLSKSSTSSCLCSWPLIRSTGTNLISEPVHMLTGSKVPETRMPGFAASKLLHPVKPCSTALFHSTVPCQRITNSMRTVGSHLG